MIDKSDAVPNVTEPGPQVEASQCQGQDIGYMGHSHAPGPNLLSGGKSFDQLFASCPDSINSLNNIGVGAQNVGNPLAGSDPRVMLTIKATKSKAENITQFISKKTKKRQRDR